MRAHSLITILLICSSSMLGQIKVQHTLAGWDRMSNIILLAANRMPAEHYDFSPAKPLTTYTGLINHYTFANYSVFAASVKLENSKVDISNTDKKTVIADLEKSLAHIRNGIVNLSEADLAEEISWWGQKTTRLNAILTMTDHFQRELGKVFTYMRIKGIAPLADNVRARGW